MKHFALASAMALGMATAATADTWDMPTPYGDATFHTQNITQFAEEVAAATDGALEITVHSGGSLFPHGEIRNVVRSGQVPIGEFFLSLLVNDDAAFGIDSQPFGQAAHILHILERDHLTPFGCAILSLAQARRGRVDGAQARGCTGCVQGLYACGTPRQGEKSLCRCRKMSRNRNRPHLPPSP